MANYLLDNYKIIIIVLSLYTFSQSLLAKDIAIVNISRDKTDDRFKYNYQVLDTALKITQPDFGEYELKLAEQYIPKQRLIPIISKGKVVNATIAVTNVEWEDNTIAIKIPVRRGILNYRVIMTNKQSLGSFKNISHIDQLKQLRVCLDRQSSTWQTFNHLGFNLVNAYNDRSLFTMLNKNRCDYIPRGVHEVFLELENYKSLTNLVLEPSLLLYIPAPFYIFVSPNTPKLAERFKVGMERMASQGILTALVEDSEGEYIKRVKQTSRSVLKVGNPLLPDGAPFNRAELWLKW
ncbi:hypothetical protein [Catenovulum maritimum]|uniref:Solute-binding protein family 3/N-terminal domain-containing protein n=1 Tax=Catenovulum maritimum TaxID=1513271 RepID=A0A0J8H089_9ALTE|nr:hypothetical protein [Catenovulum maritimum]KMT66894.1 hypothetical protein XM47_01990 [Catenovulum maritimum]